MTWADERFTAFDCETTGVDLEESRIVTASICRVSGDEPTAVEKWLINPGVEIPEEATAVHGITTEQAWKEGGDPKLLLPPIVRTLAGCPGPIVVFRASFDFTILDREARRHGVEPLVDVLEDMGRPIRCVDPHVLDKHLDRFRKGSRKLADTCEHYGAVLDDAHESESDAVAAARLAWVMNKRGEIVRRVRNPREGYEKKKLRLEWERVRDDVDELHMAQIRWYRDQQEGLREHREKTGEPTDDITTHWPIVPYAS